MYMNNRLLGWVYRFSSPTVFATAAVSLLLTACGGGGGQDPDPILQDFPIAYVERPIPIDEDGNPIEVDITEPAAFNPGAVLYVRERASANSSARNISARAFDPGEPYDIKDVEISYDGNLVIFAMRAPEIPNADEQPTWNLWVYDIAGDRLKRIISEGLGDILAEGGEDMAPNILPDGRVIFASTRQRTAQDILVDEGNVNEKNKAGVPHLDEDRNVEAVALHVLDIDCRDFRTCETSDSSSIRQISFNQSHDLDPTILDSGEILFSRWDNMANRDAISLYKILPDGTGLQPVYGAHSHDTGTDGAEVQFIQPREMESGRLLTILRPFTGTFGGGEITAIDIASYVDNDQPVWQNQGVLFGPAQSPATNLGVRSDGLPSPGGRFSSAFPLWDGTGRILASWSPCRLELNGDPVICNDQTVTDPNVVELQPLYGIWMFDPDQGTQLPVVNGREGVMYTDVVAAQPRGWPGIPFQTPADPVLANRGAGVLEIASVHDFGNGSFSPCLFTLSDCTTAGGIAELADPVATPPADRPARFIRIIKGVSIPDDEVVDLDNDAFGISDQQGMREVIGYAPIDPDGSVRVAVPANVPLSLSLLDERGHRIGPRHQNWFHVRPGETLRCTGCHTHTTAQGETPLPHAHSGGAPSINPGAARASTPFPNTRPSIGPDVFFGDTMAQVRTRLDPAQHPAFDPTSFAIEPNLGLLYEDIWTDPTAGTPGASISAQYADLDPSVPAPTPDSCLNLWDSLCRIIINYEQHIHPIWSVPRGMDGADTCTNCHGTVNLANNMAQVPSGQLDLTGDTRGANGWYPPYEQLFTTRQELACDDPDNCMNLVIRTDVVTDANGDPVCQTDGNGDPIPLDPMDPTGPCVPVTQTFNVPASMSTAGARASARFFTRFYEHDATLETVNHVGRLSPAELKLLTEWVDIGAQYFNDPFDPDVLTN
jgi:hypothetical protein